jgi:Outer membrane protein beta-barrel domain
LKRILSIVIIILALFFYTQTKAQIFSGDPNRPADSTLPKGEFGLKLGGQMQSMSGQFWKNDYQAGILGGFWVRMHKNKFGVRVEVLVSTFRLNSGKIPDSSGNLVYSIADTLGNKGDFRGTYLDVPVMLEYSILSSLLLQAGIQYSNMIALTNLTALKGNYQDQFIHGEFAGLIGLEVKLPLNFSVGARYKYGFSDNNNAAVSLATDHWKTNAVQLFACYKIK